MSDTMEAPAWAKGQDIGLLKSLAALFKAEHGPHCFGAFVRVKEVHIAEAASSGRALWTKERDACALFRIASASSSIEDFAGNEIRTEPGDLVIKAIAGPARERLLAALIERAQAQSIILEGFMESPEFRALADGAGFAHIATKILASSEIKGLFYKGQPRPYPPIRAVDIPANRILAADFISPDEQAAILAEAEAAALWAQHYSGYNKRHTWTAFAIQGFDASDPGFIIKPIEMAKSWKAENPERLRAICQPTIAAERFPIAMSIAARVPGRKERIRLMRLSAGGGELSRHADITDPDVGTGDRQLSRIHIPLLSAETCKFATWDMLGRKSETHFPERAICYLDTRKPHAVKNPAAIERVHLVMDTFGSDQLREWIARDG